VIAAKGSTGARIWSDECSPDLTFTDGDVGIVPVGAVEQHGPHLPTGTDTIIAEWLCRAASSQTGAIVLPSIAVANSQGHGVGLPGTFSLGPELLTKTVELYAKWAATSGLTRLLFINAHLGNAAAMGVALDNIRFHRPDLRAGVVDWWKATPDLWTLASGDGEDFHANKAETSVMLFITPQTVRTERMGSADDPDRTSELVFRYTAPSLSRNGVTGRPSEADSAFGEHLLDLAVTAICARIQQGRTEAPPLGEAPTPQV
jgi:creatinine amidohydrolase